MTLQQIAKDTCIVRNTAGRKGRTLAVGPGANALRYLHYGRIVLDAGDAPVRFDTNELETGLVCLKGSATVRANGEAFTLGRLDSLYVPRDASIEVNAGTDGCDLAEVAAPGGSINFLWMMAANREREDRKYGVVNVQPEFASVPSGLDKAR